MKKVLPYILIIAIMLVVLYVYRHSKKESPSVTQITTASSTPFRKETASVSISITYPAVPGTTTSIAQTNEAIKKELEQVLIDFQKEADNSMQADIGLPKDIKSTANGSPSIEEKNDRYVSIFMSTEWYVRGAAHPSHVIRTYVYDYKAQKLVNLSDMFLPNSNYLGLLSKLSKEDLLAQSKTGDTGLMYDSSMMEDGTAPRLQNFATALPLKDGLAIYFNEYQVAPYAAGPQQVVIPYAKLQEVIDPNGVLGIYK